MSVVCISSHFILLLSINFNKADGKHLVLAVINSTRPCRPFLEHVFSGFSLKIGNIQNRSKYSSFESKWRTSDKSFRLHNSQTEHVNSHFKLSSCDETLIKMHINALCLNYMFILRFSDVSLHLLEYSLRLESGESTCALQCVITIPDY